MVAIPGPMRPWGAGSVMSGGQRSGSNFRFKASVEMGNLPTLPERLEAHFIEALIFHMQDAARRVIVTARSYLVRLEEPPTMTGIDGKPIHGYDTGLMYISLMYQLAAHLLASGEVAYDLLSEEADYWLYMEFGFHTRSGKWWPGYHFLETAVHENEGYIRSRVREAWADTAIKLAAEGRAPGGKFGSVIGLAR